MTSPIAIQLLQAALRGLAQVGDQLDDRLRQIFTDLGVPVPPTTRGEQWSTSVRLLAEKLEGQGGLDRFIAAIQESRARQRSGVERLAEVLKKKP